MTSIAVVIPCYNDAELLEQCLRAIAAQTRRPDELIVVDNASTDHTREVAAAAGARVVDQPVRGIWPATAAGFDAARSEILARLDADSVPDPGWLSEVERRMSAPDRPTAISESARFYGGDAFRRWFGRNVYLALYFHLVAPMLLGHPPLFGSNYALRRDAWLVLRDIVHRDRADVHDDMDLTWWLQPGMRVVRDPRLAVTVSARPFDSWSALGRRVGMALHTFAVDFREWPPLRRRRDHAAARRGRPYGVEPGQDLDEEGPLAWGDR